MLLNFPSLVLCRSFLAKVSPDSGLRTGISGPRDVTSIVLPTDDFRLDVDLDFLLTGGVGAGFYVVVPLVAALFFPQVRV